MLVGLNEAARLAGKDQSTITRAYQAGRLSFTKDARGNPMFDPAELERVYGPLRPPEEPPPTDALERAIAAEVAGLQQEVHRLVEHMRTQRERTLAQRLRLVFGGKAA